LTDINRRVFIVRPPIPAQGSFFRSLRKDQKMKRAIGRGLLAVGLLALLAESAPSARAQTVVLSDDFTFSGTSPCSSVTSWNGDPNAYPYEMGSICLNQGDSYGGYGSFLDVPFQLGFLNNGYLAGCNPLSWGPKAFTIGDGTPLHHLFHQRAGRWHGHGCRNRYFGRLPSLARTATTSPRARSIHAVVSVLSRMAGPPAWVRSKSARIARVTRSSMSMAWRSATG
jgi:hypothetical protein